MGRRAAIYGVLLAAGMALLQWLDYQRIARFHPIEISLLLVSALFLALGVWIGARLLAAKPLPFDADRQRQAALGISDRERMVLEHLAAGQSNKEIARTLDVSPNTIKTHLANLYEKLGARRRTEAIARARDLGLIR